MQQKVKNNIWIDEAGMKIPVNRITPVERLMERRASEVYNKAIAANAQLAALKELIRTCSADVYDRFMEEKGIEQSNSKGYFTWYNFDHSVKIEVSIQDRITFDDMTIAAAQETLNAFLNEVVDSKFDFVKDLVRDAFATSRGRLDAKKVLGLIKYRDRIDHPKFHEATSLIESSIRRPDSKTYFRVFIRNEEGQYEAIELNFSNV